MKKREVPAVLRTAADMPSGTAMAETPLPVVPLIEKLNRIHEDRHVIQELILDGVKGSEIQRLYAIDNSTYSKLCRQYKWEKPLDRAVRMLREQNQKGDGHDD